MTFLELSKNLLRRLNEDVDDPQFWSANDIKDFINEAYVIIASRLSLLSTSTTLSLKANQWLYDLADDCYSVLRVYYTPTSKLLKPMTFETLIRHDMDWIQVSSSSPIIYVPITSKKIFIYPCLDADSTDCITYHYSKIPPKMTSNSEIPDIPVHYHDVLIDYAISIAILRERTPTSKQRARDSLTEYKDKFGMLDSKMNNRSNRVKQVRRWGT